MNAASRLRAAAAVRIGYGVLWAITAAFKWMPGFIHGQTLPDQFAKASTIRTPVVHQVLELNRSLAGAHPGLFAHVVAVLETAVAVGLLLGIASNAAFVGSALLSLGIWVGAEGMHLPWFTPGQTDLGPSIGYVFASLALLAAGAGATWSLDARLSSVPRRLAWAFATSPLAGGPATQSRLSESNRRPSHYE